MPARPRAAGLCLLAVAGVLLAGCGGTHRIHRRHRGPEVVGIYSSLPLEGPDAAAGRAVQNGIRLALTQADDRAGRFRVSYHALDDARSSSKPWSAAQVQRNADAAAADIDAVYYIGELSAGASEVSMPTLNEARLAQVSPTATALALTRAAGGQGDIQPSGNRTFLRIVPNDGVEAAAEEDAMRGAGCRRVAVAYEASPYGTGQALTLQELAPDYHLQVRVAPAVGAASARAYAGSLRAGRFDCFEYAGTSTARAVAITDAVHLSLPGAKLFVLHPLCTPRFTNTALGGVSAGVDTVLQCTTILAPLDQYPGGRAFATAYRVRFGSAPSTVALFGYEAMRLGLSTIASLGSRGADRSAVVSALFQIRGRRSVLGTYGFDSYGDTTLRTIALYRCASGTPTFYRVLAPPSVP